MKIGKKMGLLFLAVVLLTGCGNSSGTEEEISSEDLEEQVLTTEHETKESLTEPDFDLTEMSSDMVYATVYQMVSDPDQYIGKRVRMEGTYYAAYSEGTEQYYHCCLIKDAMVCCAQGIEFVWEDGSHIYPDEYPADNEDIVVEGIFETYTEEGDSNLYCRLADASLQRK